MTADIGEEPQASTAPEDSRGRAELIHPVHDAPAPLVCPVCGGENAPDAVFCANPACHKALGEFDYVLEVLRAEARWHERLAEKVTAFIGKPQFLAVHALWLALWVAINTGVFAFIRTFDEYPFGLLGLILAAEAIFITGWILISNNRQNAHADKRAELDYEVSVRNHRQISHIDAKLNDILERLERLESAASSGDQGPAGQRER
jgi:uncharacterized membrane protein